MQCQVAYDGSKMPEHLSKGMVFESARLVHGETTEVDDVLAGAMIANYPEAIRVVSGAPVPWVRTTGATRREVLLEAERVQAFGLDPARALTGVPSLTTEQKKATRPEIEAGKHDAHLGPLAMWAQLDGKTDISAACVRRAEALRLSKR